MIEICIFFIIISTLNLTFPKQERYLCKGCRLDFHHSRLDSHGLCDHCFYRECATADGFRLRGRCIDTLDDGDMPCISLACGTSDSTSILHFLLIYAFLAFLCFPAHCAAAFPRFAALFATFSHASLHSHALLCFLAHFAAFPHLPALRPTFTTPCTTFPCSPSVVVPYSLVFHLCTLVPGPLSTFLSI